MVIQKFLSLCDRVISSAFSLEVWGTGDEKGTYRWTHFGKFGRSVGVVGTDGEIRTLMGFWAVSHHLEKGKLTKRVFVRKDLREGERLATEEEIRSLITKQLQALDEPTKGICG